ncbi:unnamed protein product [Adineta steineri]|uniref:Protein kinase domain-containing protein n=1 Tax=Adineta steineri TaxID=433720 RepID=A0A814SU18_9BILA|nr:unnamed protein product [Adineta steineri]
MLKRLKNIFNTSISDDTIASKNLKDNLLTKSSRLYKEQTPLNEWKLIKELGDGAFGKVYQAYNEQNKQYAAVKIIDDCTDDELPEHLVEVDILTDCNHKNIIKLYDTYLFETKLYIFLEYCTYGAVDYIMTTLEHGLDEKQIRFIGYQVLEALDYLHTQQFVIHRDIKASNILLTQTGQVKLADFGVSAKNSHANQKRNDYIGTVYWMAPEVFFCEANTDMSYDFRVDIWSFGITLIEMAEMDPPYHEMRAERVGAKIRQATPPTLKNIRQWSTDFFDILTCCLKRDPNERKTCQELKQHPFMLNTQEFHSSILFLLEEYKATPVVEEVEEEIIPPESQPKDTINNETSLSKNPIIEVDLIENNSLVNDNNDIPTAIDNHNNNKQIQSDSTPEQKHRLSNGENMPPDLSTVKEDDHKKIETSNNVTTKPPPVPILTSSNSVPKPPPLPSFVSNTTPTTTTNTISKIPVVITTQFQSRTLSESKESSPPMSIQRVSPTSSIINEQNKQPTITIERIPSFSERPNEIFPTRKGANIEIGRLEIEDLARRELDNRCELYYQDLLEEIIQSDFEKPSIPEVILSVITDLTADDVDDDDIEQTCEEEIEFETDNIDSIYYFKQDKPRLNSSPMLNTNNDIDYYYTCVRQAVENGNDHDTMRSINNSDQIIPIISNIDQTSNSLQTRETRRRTIRTTRRFVGPDGKEKETITTKIVEPHDDYQSRLIERKEAHREFRRLYHLEEKRRQQLLVRHEFEIDEQRQEFRRKREELMRKYDGELQAMEQKHNIEIERENILLTNEYNKKIKQLKTDQEKEFKQFREQLREQIKQIKREYDSPTSTYHNSQTLKDRKEHLKRYLTEKEDESYVREKEFLDNQQQIYDNQLKTIENYYAKRIEMFEKQFQIKKQNLLKINEQELWDIDELELRSRYDLLRKQTKSFYALFRTMLTQQSEKELQQLDEQIRFERNTLEARLIDDKREWPKLWKKMQKTRTKQFRQQLIMNKTSSEEEKKLIKKVIFEQFKDIMIFTQSECHK